MGLYLGLLIVGVSIGNILASRLIGRFSIERLLMAGNFTSLAAAIVVLAAFVFLRPDVFAIEALMIVYCVGAGCAARPCRPCRSASTRA